MKDIDRKIATEFKQRLERKNVPIIDVIGYSRHQDDDALLTPDVNVLIIVDCPVPEVEDIVNDVAWDVGVAYGTVLHHIVLTKSEYENSLFSDSGLIRIVQNDGIHI